MLFGQSTHVAIATILFVVVSKSVDGFAPMTPPQQKSQSNVLSLSMAQQEQEDILLRGAMVSAASFVAAAAVFFSPVNTVAFALEGEDFSPDTTTTTVAAPKYSIAKCDVSNKAPACVSTSNVRQLDLYAPPWTFASNADEAMARLKGAVEVEPLNSIVSSEDNANNRRLLVDSKRSKLGGTAYRMEFLINEADGVITFRSSAPSDITGPDFGLQRKRLSEVRERAGTFGVMGEEFDSADAKTIGEKGNGPLGQLKAFYGLQSGGGFEDVLAE
mmetsp:Transcript_65682/g.133622  ORF Transcript_65682/g.133622 Transcript_65682/m.133622 type:complete len:273 (-) Transcript_65682:121-939(-)|eukprot:CAMPEP_0201197018 /NCGR_PEP_ID=MMETSP0851-20130426/153920_1 /ASSEMBLY_ACC=CAM_ASM_000631 /TAXON_ID=183588 /ORGANISM="Pseudo-nitzschia fraudulenta, Strain WWA7" /LENGTH=272 /DNA_ID=CAMNT_0047484059 /DNA_START=58 /DNA_END=876 /DNA_ORIENTATION=+